MRVVYYVAASLDGYIARLDGDVSWLDELDIPMEATGYNEFFADIDGLIMGRKTWEQIAGFGEWPYGDLPSWVVSGQDIESIAGIEPQPRAPLAESVEAARSLGLQNLWVVGGGQLAAGLINEALLTDIVVVQMPVILGRGIGLFSGVRDLTRLEFVSGESNPLGFTELSYKVASGG